MRAGIAAPPGVAPSWRDSQARAVLPLLLLVTLMGTASAMVTTIVSLNLSHPDVPPLAVRAVLTAYPAGFLAGCIAARTLVNRFGHQRAFALVTGLAVVASAGFVATDAKPVWIVLRLAGGVSMAAMFVICESWMNLYAQAHNRGRLFSLYMLATAAAVLCGQLLLALIGPAYGFSAAMLVVAGAFLGRLAAGAWPELPRSPAAGATPVSEAGRFGLLGLFRVAPVTVVSIFQSGITNLNIFVLTPIYAAKIGLSPSQALALVTTVSVAGMLAQTPAGWLSDRFDRRAILLAQGCLAALLCLAIAALGAGPAPLLFALFFAYGGIVLTVYPVAVAFANARLPSRHMVSASGSLLFLYSVGNIVTPGLASGLMDHTVPQAMLFLLGSGGVLVACSALANLLMKATPPGLDEPEAPS